MKNLFWIMCVVAAFSINGMDEQCACAFLRNDDDEWSIHSSVKYTKTDFYGTTIAVAKGNVCEADGVVDVIVGHKNALKNKRVEISSGMMVHSYYKYGRYSLDYESKQHREGVICFPLPWRSDDKQYTVVDAEENPHSVRSILCLEYTTVLDNMKRLFPLAQRIALSSLGTEIGFPTKMTIPLAVKGICKFIKKNPNAYSEIFLFVKKQSLIQKYIQMFEKYSEYCELFE